MKVSLTLVVFLTLLAAACTPGGDAPTTAQTPTQALAQPPGAAPTLQITVTPPAAESSPQSTACTDPDALNLANVVASGYAFTSPEEVMGWFCNGADFEDIIIALETEDQTGVPAEDLLTMLAGGMTWEEIWQSIGWTE